MPKFVRLVVPALLGALLGCTRQAQTAPDGGLSPAPSAQRRAEAGPPPPPAVSVEGRVLWRGPRPVPAKLPTSASVRSVCGNEVEDDAFQVDVDGGVAEVVAWVDAKAEPIPSPSPEAVLDQRGCLYRPAVLAARAGGTLRLRNSDPLTHTVHAASQGKSLFDVAMPLEHMELVRQLPVEPAVVEVRCDVHPWMRASVRTFDHPHFATTRKDGHFEITGVSPGGAELHVWHPRLGEASRHVQVGNGVTHADFEFGGPP